VLQTSLHQPELVHQRLIPAAVVAAAAVVARKLHLHHQNLYLPGELVLQIHPSLLQNHLAVPVRRLQRAIVPPQVLQRVLLPEQVPEFQSLPGLELVLQTYLRKEPVPVLRIHPRHLQNRRHHQSLGVRGLVLQTSPLPEQERELQSPLQSLVERVLVHQNLAGRELGNQTSRQRLVPDSQRPEPCYSVVDRIHHHHRRNQTGYSTDRT
jgi:hypothetical protein